VEGIPRGTDKLSRAYDVAPMIEAGNVLLPTENPHLSDMLLELAMFPRGVHDDTIDPMMDAISDMLIKQPAISHDRINYKEFLENYYYFENYYKYIDEQIINKRDKFIEIPL
jgi:hypothetical protein